MRFRWQKFFSIKKFLQSLVTILLGMIAFLYAFRAWMDTAQLPLAPTKSGEIEMILIHSGETKIVKAPLRSLANLLVATDCVLA